MPDDYFPGDIAAPLENQSFLNRDRREQNLLVLYLREESQV